MVLGRSYFTHTSHLYLFTKFVPGLLYKLVDGQSNDVLSQIDFLLAPQAVATQVFR